MCTLSVVYSHDGPSGRRMRGYILTTDQSVARGNKQQHHERLFNLLRSLALMLRPLCRQGYTQGPSSYTQGRARVIPRGRPCACERAR
eukprot:872225-Pyramimonas_sp.AAC.2